MIKTKKSFAIAILLTLIVLILSCSCFFINNVSAKAEAVESDQTNEVAEPRGLMTQISLSIGATSSDVWARAHNDFTLGFSTVQVYVYLYSSLQYEDNYSNMTLENAAYISDLNINKTLEITVPINGVQRYWRARAKYKLDNKDWATLETKTYLVNENGILLD